MKLHTVPLLTLFILNSCAVSTSDKIVKEADVEKIIRALSSDEMQGRATFTDGVDKAATFIANEFEQIGLQSFSEETSFRQTFYKYLITLGEVQATIGSKKIQHDKVFVLTDKASLIWNSDTDIEITSIKQDEDFFTRYQELTKGEKLRLVFVDQKFADSFKRLKDHFAKGHAVDKLDEKAATVFILGKAQGNSFQINYTNKIEKKPLFNVAGIIPGKSKAKEFVVFSAHYDHLGIIEASEGDSIANGADDDASGVTAVISLAKYFKKLNNNERTLLFVAFTAEEIGGYGSQYFSKKLNPDDVTTMFNIEMIGKESKFGKNAAFITGFEKSDFGAILQRNLKGTNFTFHPDPYPNQNLFYRSDNATLAALGVPAHTISTDQIDIDKLYHTVNDELGTLNVANITATIKAIALSSRSIVSGKDTPTRIPKLEK